MTFEVVRCSEQPADVLREKGYDVNPEEENCDKDGVHYFWYKLHSCEAAELDIYELVAMEDGE